MSHGKYRIKERLENFYWSLERLIIPNFEYPQYLYEKVLSEHVNKNIAWLDLGCGHHVLPEWRQKEEKELVSKCVNITGIDYEHDALVKNMSIKHKVRGDITSLPFKRETFDLISSNMVLEHVKDPLKIFKEINDILKPNGIFIFHTPNLYGYVALLSKIIPEGLQKKLVYIIEQRNEEDTFPTYYLVNTEESIKKLAAKSGFFKINVRLIVSSAKFGVIPPIAILELFWIKLCTSKMFRQLRTNIIVILTKES